MAGRNDLTDGAIWKKLIAFFIPIAAGTIFQQLYNAVDGIIVGKFVGTDALAAVGGSAAVVSNVLIGFFTALASGSAVVISQDYGARDFNKVSREIHTSLTFCLLVGIIIGLVVIAVAPWLLILLKTPAETLEMATTYTRIYFAGSVFTLVYNMGAGIIRSMGDSARPFRYLLVSCLTNIVLDLVFVIVFKWGVSGVAWATVIAQGVSTVLVLIDLFRLEPEFRVYLKKLRIEWGILKQMMKIGIPSGLESSVYGLSHIIIQVGTNTLGTVIVASWAMSSKIDGVYWSVATALGMAVTTFVGQNYGAGKRDRIKKCVRTSFILFSSITVALSGLILLFARPLLTVFTDDIGVREATWELILYFVPYYFIWTVIEILTGVLRGIGDATKPVIITLVGVCLFRMVWMVTVFKWYTNLLGLAFCYPASWVVTAIALAIYYYFFSEMKIVKRKKA